VNDALLMVVVVTLLLGGGLGLYFLTPNRATDKPAKERAVAAPHEQSPVETVPETSSSSMLGDARHHYYCTAFGVKEFDAAIEGDHQKVLEEVRRSLSTITEQERLLPRRPMLIPQLLRALNDVESTRTQLSSIILQDPVLAGDVLKLANSPYYRVTREPVDSIDRAIVLLGTEGLKSVVAASILQPVFRLQKGHFDAFAATLWDLALRTATAAGIYAAHTHSADRFTAQLLGLLSALGPLALFRMTSDVYRTHAGMAPRAEVFIQLIETEGGAVSSAIAAHWHLPETFVSALTESHGAGQLKDRELTPLGRALEAGRCCALLSLAPASNRRTIEANKAAMAMGLETTAFDAVWSALAAEKSGAR
jgi:HD-like signal output (HDOD) protein